MLAPKYVLSASGAPSLPTLDIIVNAADDVEADRMTKRMVGTLAKTGYHNFTLFTVAPPTGTNVILSTYKADLREPEVYHGTINNIGALP